MARVFISHSSRDNAEAEALFTWLKSQGFDQGFLDIDKHAGIPTGASWEQTLYEELERAQAVILLLTKNWFDSKWCFAEFTHARSRGKAIFPVVVGPDGDEFVGDDLQKLDLTKDREGGLAQLANRLTEVALLSQGGFDFPAGRAPYPGFLAFDEDDAAIYFGRDDDIRRLVQRLDSRRIEGGRRFVLVLGESGTGKSSLIRAGLVPRLKRARREWIALTPFRPEADPFHALAISLTEAGYACDGESLAEADPKEIAKALAAHHDAPRAGVLLPIDQAEELFTRTDPEVRARFFAFLSTLLGPGLPFVAVATLRSDHLGDIQTADGLTAAFEEFSLRPMPVERMGDIIRGPARIAGLEVQPELVTRITADAHSADALPLVAYALRQLYDRFGDNHKLELAEYESLRDADSKLSPLETIVRDTAARVLAEAKPSDAELKALREVFVPGLVRVNDEGGFVRRAARWDDLPEAGRRLVTALASQQARLLVVRDQEGAREVEVAHEALFRVWPLLSGWLVEEEEFLIGRNRLEKALADWRDLPEPDKAKGLIVGILLDRAKGWLIDHPTRFSTDEADFIRASEAAETERQRAAEAQRRALEEARLHQAETERDAAREQEEAAKRLTGRTRIAAVILGAVALIAVGAGYYAYKAEGEAVRQAEIAGQQKQVAETEAARANQQAEIAEAARVEADEARQTAVAESERANREAERANDQAAAAEIARARAEAEAHRATRNFELAKSTVDDVLFEISRGLQNVEGIRLETLRTILTRIEAATGRLAEAAPDDPEVQLNRALMLRQFGHVYAAAGYGDVARSSYEDSLDLAESFIKAESDNTHWHQIAAEILEKLGELDRAAGEFGRAVSSYDRSLAIYSQLAAVEPQNLKWKLGVIAAQAQIEDLRAEDGSLDAAITKIDEILDDLRVLADTEQDHTGVQRTVIGILDMLGDRKLQAGDSVGAQEAYQEVVDKSRRLVEISPANSDFKRGIAIGLIKVGNIKMRTANASSAAPVFEESLQIFVDLSEADPDNAGWQRDTALAYINLGKFRLRISDASGAAAAFDRALDVQNRLIATDPGNLEWQSDYVDTLFLLGDFKLRQGDLETASLAYAEGANIVRRLAEIYPQNHDWQWGVAKGLINSADIKAWDGDSAGATADYEEGLAILKRLASSSDLNFQLHRQILATLKKVGDLRLNADDVSGAARAYEEGLTVGRRLSEIDPDNLHLQADISAVWDKLGDVRFQARDAAGTLEAYDAALTTARRLAQTDSTNTLWAKNYAVSLTKLGDFRRGTGDPAGAKEAYEESVRIFRQLTTAEPTNIRGWTDLAVGLLMVQSVTEDVELQRQFIDDALKILNDLDQRGVLPGDQRHWIDLAETRLAELP